MFDYARLRAPELAGQVAMLVDPATTRLPTEEPDGLTSKIRLGAVSVNSNIVSFATNLQFSAKTGGNND